MAQLVARDVWDVDAAGSNPVTPTKNREARKCFPVFERCGQTVKICSAVRRVQAHWRNPFTPVRSDPRLAAGACRIPVTPTKNREARKCFPVFERCGQTVKICSAVRRVQAHWRNPFTPVRSDPRLAAGACRIPVTPTKIGFESNLKAFSLCKIAWSKVAHQSYRISTEKNSVPRLRVAERMMIGIVQAIGLPTV